jgi:hypothetical protein
VLTLMRRRAGVGPGVRDQRGITMVELVVSMSIMGVLTIMILVGWFALSRSYSFSLSSSDSRDMARQSVSRMAREIRDAENNLSASDTAIVRARARWIEFYTTFNMASNEASSTAPRLVMYRLYPDGELWRFYDQNTDGTIQGVDTGVADATWPVANALDSQEQVTGEGGMMMADHLVNDSIPSATNPTPVFEYEHFTADGSVALDPVITGVENRAAIVAVQIELLADLNPKKVPVYATFKTTTQIRNNR